MIRHLYVNKQGIPTDVEATLQIFGVATAIDDSRRGFPRGMITEKEKILAEVIAAHAEYCVYSPLERKDCKEFICLLRPKQGIGNTISLRWLCWRNYPIPEGRKHRRSG